MPLIGMLHHAASGIMDWHSCSSGRHKAACCFCAAAGAVKVHTASLQQQASCSAMRHCSSGQCAVQRHSPELQVPQCRVAVEPLA